MEITVMYKIQKIKNYGIYTSQNSEISSLGIILNDFLKSFFQHKYNFKRTISRV